MQRAEDRARDARRAAAGVEPVSAVHRAREDAVHGMLARARRDREAQERAVAAAARSVFVGLCEASPERPDLRCDADDRKWLDGKLAVAGSAYLADAAPFAHRAAVAAEELAEAEASFDAVDRRFERLPRLDRKETFGLRGLVAPFVYGRPDHATTDCEDCRKGLAEAASKLNKALLLDRDGGRVADDFVRTATSKATTYFSTYGAVDWNHKDVLDNPSKRHAAVARAFKDGACRVKGDASSTVGEKRVDKLCAPWSALKHEMRGALRRLRGRAKATTATLAALGPWAAAAGRVGNASGDAAVVAAYAAAREAAARAARAAEFAHERTVDGAPGFVPENGTDAYGNLSASLGEAADRHRAVAQALATDPEARALASLDAAVAELNATLAREAALEADARAYVDARPSEKLLIAARDAENKLAHLAGEAKKAGFALQDALAAAAAANALGPPPSREDADALREAYRRSLAAHGAAAGALRAAEAAVGADVAADAHGAVAALAFALDRRVDAPSVAAAHRARQLAALLKTAEVAGSCAPDVRDGAPPPAAGAGARLVARRAAGVLSLAAPNAARRWVAALPCGFEVGPRAAWFGAAADAALGLAVLRGEAHVVAGPAPRGALRFWPGSPPDFAPADGAWLLRRDEGA